MQRTGLAFVGLCLALGACAPSKARMAVKAPAQCMETAVPVYFEPGAHELTSESRTALANAATSATGCRIGRVLVLGLADAEGGPAANLELSKKRAQSVTEALAAVKLPAAQFQTAAAGETGAVTPTGTAEPMRRRVDVVLQMQP